MQLHEPIDVGCEPIDTILHYGESLVHLLTEITKFKVDEPKLLIYLPESRIYLAESFVYLPESCIRLPEAASNKFFEGGELLIDGSRFLCRFFYCHLFFLAAANWTESQDEILANRLIADEIDIPRFFPAAPRLMAPPYLITLSARVPILDPSVEFILSGVEGLSTGFRFPIVGPV